MLELRKGAERIWHCLNALQQATFGSPRRVYATADGDTKPRHRFKEAVVKLSTLVMLLACTTASIAAQSPSSRTETLPIFTYKPNVDDYYPPASRNLKEQGTTTLKFCYDQRGRSRQVTVHQGSGFPKLDAAAVLWGRGVRVKPGFSSGEPMPGCVPVSVTFSLEKSGDVPPELQKIPLPPPPPPGRFIPLGN